MRNQRGSAAIIGIVAVVLGLAVGLGIGKMADTKVASEQTAKTDTKAADLRVLLNSLEKEHAHLASAATRNGFDGDPAFKASGEALDANSVELADAVGSVYGPEAREKFLEIWRSHITFFVNYTVAAKAGDQAGMDKAVADLGGYVDAISDFFSKANENLPRQAVRDLISEHVSMLKSAVDAHAAGNYSESFAQERATAKQIGKVADAMAGAIVKQNASKF